MKAYETKERSKTTSTGSTSYNQYNSIANDIGNTKSGFSFKGSENIVYFQPLKSDVISWLTDDGYDVTIVTYNNASYTSVSWSESAKDRIGKVLHRFIDSNDPNDMEIADIIERLSSEKISSIEIQ